MWSDNNDEEKAGLGKLEIGGGDGNLKKGREGLTNGQPKIVVLKALAIAADESAIVIDVRY